VAHSADVDVDDSDRLRRRRAHRAVLNATYRLVGEGVELRTLPHNRGTVPRLLERGEGVPRRGRPLSLAQIEQATELYATGLSLVSVGKQLGCDGSTIHLALRKAGVPMRDRQGRQAAGGFFTLVELVLLSG
jgi:hypothetical protein